MARLKEDQGTKTMIRRQENKKDLIYQEMNNKHIHNFAPGSHFS